MKGGAILTILPFMTITLALCIMLAEKASNTAEKLVTTIHGRQSMLRESNNAIGEAFRVVPTHCIETGAMLLCPLKENSGFRDPTPLFLLRSPCRDERKLPLELRGLDDILSVKTCVNSSLKNDVESFHSNLLLSNDTVLKGVKLLAVLGQTKFERTVTIENNFTLVSIGSVYIHSITTDKNVTVVSTRTITIDSVHGRGRVQMFSLKDPNYTDRSVPFLPLLMPPLWSLREIVDTLG